ncbi:MAG: hypothetical protein R3F61_32325 [Myxococcota bacterium]
MSIVVYGLADQRQDLVRCARSAAAGRAVSVVSSRDELEAHVGAVQLVFTGTVDAPTVLECLKDAQSRSRVVLVESRVETHTLRLALASARVVGVMSAEDGSPPSWEVNYVTRRVVSPSEPTPWVSDVLPWGTTNISWTPKSTADLRRIVTQIEGMARSLGCERREAMAVSTAAHELLMNAMYDAPVGPDGRPLYAHDRANEITLGDHEVPRFRFTLGSDFLGLDASDPFGRLPRNRFFEGVLRGHMNMTGEGAPALDTSHGGAGLGLHTLYSSGTVLRAELHPLKRTHVSWMLQRRGAAHRPTRSLFFAPITVSE